MGNSNTSLRKDYAEAIDQLGTVEVSKLSDTYKELHDRGGKKGGLVDRNLFSEYFNISPILSERLFDAFDRKKNGLVDFEEFVCGVTLLLHGTFEEKCQFLFDVFNIAGDEGVSYEELTSILAAIATSADLVLATVYHPSSSALLEAETTQEAVKRVADAAFEKCDITGTGKLLPLEFQYWLEQNPHIVDALLPLQHDNSNTISVVVSEGAKKSPETSQHDNEVVIASPMVKIDQKINESADNQDSTGVMASQNIDQATNTPVDISNQGSGEVVDTEEIDVDQAVEEDVTDQEVNKSQESIDVASIQETSEVATSQEIDEAVNMQETVNTQELVNTQETVNTEEMVNEHINTQVVVNHGDTQVAVSSEDMFPLANNSQDIIIPGDAIDPPQHKTLLDLWQHSFVLTHPSCVDCSSKSHSLWHEPVMDKTPTRPLQHYTSSANSDQVMNNVGAVSMDIVGFQQLLDRGQYPAALELSGRFLSAHGQGYGSTGSSLHTEHTLAMWSGRLLLLYQMGYYKECAKELEHFKGFNQPDLFYQSYADRYGDQRGSMIPFMLRLLDAELPQYCREPTLALDRLYMLKESCEKLLSSLGDDQSDAVALWQNRHAHVMLAIGNCLLSIQEYTLAIEVYRQLCQLVPDKLQPTVISATGRIHLLLGDVAAAKECFAAAITDQLEEQLQSQLNRVAVMIFQSAYSDAYELTQKMLLRHSNNLLVLNNAAVCAFYIGRQQEAMQLLQKATQLYTSEAITTNMRAIYDLESSSGGEVIKRRSLAQPPKLQ